MGFYHHFAVLLQGLTVLCKHLAILLHHLTKGPHCFAEISTRRGCHQDLCSTVSSGHRDGRLAMLDVSHLLLHESSRNFTFLVPPPRNQLDRFGYSNRHISSV
ncbi:unnamed protein product [Linum trigynum]|uniref:Secreted protein n=1 Tax=Linum trigynum TaxID=586398 RepID=A0AAV2CFQ7_9ROSI